MKESWEIHWEDYYEILGVIPQATLDEIKRAWIDKSWILAPDRMNGAPETAKKKAEEELKKVNNSYDILKDPEKRKRYHASYLQRTGKDSSYVPPPSKPKPEMNPTKIRFEDNNSVRYTGQHPPYCTCVNCGKQRRERRERESGELSATVKHELSQILILCNSCKRYAECPYNHEQTVIKANGLGFIRGGEDCDKYVIRN